MSMRPTSGRAGAGGGLTAEERLLRDTGREFAQHEVAPRAPAPSAPAPSAGRPSTRPGAAPPRARAPAAALCRMWRQPRVRSCYPALV